MAINGACPFTGENFPKCLDYGGFGGGKRPELFHERAQQTGGGGHTGKRKSLVERRDLITVEIEQHNKADDQFSERLVDVVEIGGNTCEHFQLSNVEGKRRLVNLIFSTVKLRGRKLEYALRCPFNDFIKVEEMDKWRRNSGVNTKRLYIKNLPFFKNKTPNFLLV